MKALILIVTVAFSVFIQQESPKLKGTYRVEFDKKYQLQHFQLTFNDSTYVKRMPDAVTSNGKVLYGKYKILLRKNNAENPIEIDSREISKDTINFTTKNKSDLSLNVNRGKMIKVN